MKKIVTLLLTAALAVTAATTAFADEATTQINPGADGKPNPASNPILVTYTVAPSYTVTIPAKVTLTSQTKQVEATVKAENVTIPKGQEVQVKLTSDFTATYDADTTAAKLTYAVTKPDSPKPLSGGETVLAVDSDTSADKCQTKLTFEIVGKAKYSGSYTGKVTFTVSLGTASGN